MEQQLENMPDEDSVMKSPCLWAGRGGNQQWDTTNVS
jgi:hypothetical protein